MLRVLRFIAVLVVALGGLPFLPLFLERTMMRSQYVGRIGDVITTGFALRTLFGFWQDFRYMRSEQYPGLFLVLNVCLLLTYASFIALGVDRYFTRRRQ